MSSWFISWCTYTTSQADGLVVDRFGSCIKDYPSQIHPEQVMDDIIVNLKNAQGTDYVHILALSRV